MFTVFAKYAVAPTCIDGAEVTVTADFAAFAANLGYTEVSDYTKYGGNIEYFKNANRAGQSFIVKIGDYTNYAVAAAIAEGIKIAGRSTQ